MTQRVGFEEVEQVLNEMDAAFDTMLVLNSRGEGPIPALLEEMRLLMLRKGHDYSGTQHTFSSFEWSAHLLGQPIENSFLEAMAKKFARLVGLGTQPEPPANEPVEDTWIDLADYIVLLLAWRRFTNGKR